MAGAADGWRRGRISGTEAPDLDDARSQTVLSSPGAGQGTRSRPTVAIYSAQSIRPEWGPLLGDPQIAVESC